MLTYIAIIIITTGITLGSGFYHYNGAKKPLLELEVELKELDHQKNIFFSPIEQNNTLLI